MQTSACAWGLGSANPLINLSHGCTGAPKEGPGLAGQQGLRLPSGSSWFAGDTEKGELRPMQRRGWGVTRQWLGGGDSHFRTWPWLQGRWAETLAPGMN